MASEYTYRVSAWWTSGRTGLAKCESSPNTIHFSEAAELGGLAGSLDARTVVALRPCGLLYHYLSRCGAQREVRVHRPGSGDRRQRPPQPDHRMQASTKSLFVPG